MKKTHRSRIVLLVLILSLCVSALCSQAFAVTSCVYELAAKGTSSDIGNVRYKEDAQEAKVMPSSGAYYGNGARYFIKNTTSTGVFKASATGYTDRFDLITFYISYKPAYAKAGTYMRMGIYSYTQSTSYTVSVNGNWMP